MSSSLCCVSLCVSRKSIRLAVPFPDNAITELISIPSLVILLRAKVLVDLWMALVFYLSSGL